MDLIIRPMTTEERTYSYTQDKELMKKAGCIGHLRGDMDTDGNGFFTTWDNHNAKLKTQAFKTEFDEVINRLRFDEQYGGLLKNRSSLSAYCHACCESAFEGNYTTEYGFRIDTEHYAYMLRCNPNKGDYNFYCYAYSREMLEETLQPVPKTIHVLLVEPGKEPYEKDIGSDLTSLQREVGGYIQAIYPYENPCAIVANEEGKLNGFELNRALRDEDGDIYDVIAGKFLICGLGEDSFCSLRDKDMVEMKEKFKTPEMFIHMNGKMVVLPIKDNEKEKHTSVLGKLETAKQQNSYESKKKTLVDKER